MDAARTGGERRPDPSVSLFRTARAIALLLLLIAIVAPLAARGWALGALPSGLALKVAAVLCVAAIIAWLQFRSVAVALAVALAPLPGWRLALLFLSHDTGAAGAATALVYATGFLMAIVAGNRLVAGIAADAPVNVAANTASLSSGRLGLAVGLAAVALPCASVGFEAHAGFREAGILAAANFAAVFGPCLVVPFLGSFVRPSEEFISVTNRIGEDWLLRAERLAKASKMPWAWSAAGIFLVVAIVAVFGGRGLADSWSPHFARPADIVLGAILAAGVLSARGWRNVVAVWVCAGGAILVAAWGFARAGGNALAAPSAFAAEVWVFCFGLIATAALASDGERDREAATVAFSGLVENGAAVAVGATGAVFFLAPWYVALGRETIGAALGFSAALISASVVRPAISTVLEATFARRRSQAEMYRLK